jgi:hypothetical protein
MADSCRNRSLTICARTLPGGEGLPGGTGDASLSGVERVKKAATKQSAFLQKCGLEGDATLEEVVRVLDQFLMPVVDGLEQARDCYPVAPSWSMEGRYRQPRLKCAL